MGTLSYDSTKPERPVWASMEVLVLLPSASLLAVVQQLWHGRGPWGDAAPCPWDTQGVGAGAVLLGTPRLARQFSVTGLICLSLSLKVAEPSVLFKLLNPSQCFPCTPTLPAVMT